MQSSAPMRETLTHHYTIAIDALCAIARAYYTLGRLRDAQQLLRTSQQLIDARETTTQHLLRLLLLYGQVLIVDHFLMRGEAEPMFSAILNAQQIAEAAQDQRSIADALSLLGQAHYFARIVENLKQGIPL